MEKFVTVKKRRNTCTCKSKTLYLALPLINILLLSALNTFVSCIELTNLNYHYFRIDGNNHNAIGYMSDIHLSDSPTNILSKMLLILKKKIFDLIIPILAQIIFFNIY